MQPPWRLVLLEGRGASAASYPPRSVVEISRPKALVFLRLWWILSGIKGDSSELPIDFEACGDTSCKGDMMVVIASCCPSVAERRLACRHPRLSCGC